MEKHCPNCDISFEKSQYCPQCGLIANPLSEGLPAKPSITENCDDRQTHPTEVTTVLSSAIEAEAVDENIEELEENASEVNAATIALSMDSKSDSYDPEKADARSQNTMLDPFRDSAERITSLVSEDSADYANCVKDSGKIKEMGVANTSIDCVQDTLVDPLTDSVEQISALVSEESATVAKHMENSMAKNIESQDISSFATQEMFQSMANTGARSEICKVQARGVSGVENQNHTTRLEGDIFDLGEILQRKYKVVEFLGQGGMGTVYKVEHLLLPNKKFFALKLLHPHLSHNTTFRKRFIREVEMAMEFAHPHVVQIRDFGETDNGAQFFTMDFSDGKSLRSILDKDSTIPEARAFNITKQVLAALSCGHEKGIVHRDLKPENILVEKRHGKEHAMVLDFGIAKLLTDTNEEKITQHQVIGTPHYMSPEQASGEQLDMRTDLYSMGVILYEMATGQVPYQGNNREILLGHMVRPLPCPHEVKSGISTIMGRVISKAMKKDRNDRYRNAEAFIADIDGSLEVGVATTQERPMPVVKKSSGASWLIAAILLLAFAGGGGLIGYMQLVTQDLEQEFKNALKSRKYDKAKGVIDKMRLSWFTQANASGLQKRLNEKRKAFIAEGIAALQRENFKQARVKLQQAQQIEQHVAETTVLGSIAKIFEGNAFYETGNWNEASLSFQNAQKMAGYVEIPYLRKAIERCRKNIAKAGIAALKRGELQKSLHIFQQTSLQSGQFDLLISSVQKIRRGLEAQKSKNWEKACSLLKDARQRLQASDITIDRVDQSIANCEKLLTERLLERGLQLLSQEQFQSALEILDQCPEKNTRVKNTIFAITKIRRAMEAVEHKEWEKALKILESSQKEIGLIVPGTNIAVIEENISYCKKRLAATSMAKGLQLLREGKFDDARKFFKKRLKIMPNDKMEQVATAIMKIAQGMRLVKRRKYQAALNRFKESRKQLQQVSPGIELPSLETVITNCQARQKKILASNAKKNKKNLKKTLKKILRRAKREYESENYPKAQRLLEQFFDKGGAKIGGNSKRASCRMLALSYCRQGKWGKSLKWFEQIKLDSLASGYYGLAAYRSGGDHDEAALKAIDKALRHQQAVELTRDLYHARVEILLRSFPEQEHRLLRDFKEYQKLASQAKLLPYWKKLGYLAKKCGDDQEAIVYLQHYLQVTEKEDEDVINELIALQNFYPLGKGYAWEYSLLLLGGKKMRRTIEVEIVDKKGSRYSVDAAGASEEWYTEGGYLYKRNQKTIPQLLRLGKKWKRETKQRSFQAKVTDANVIVSTKAGKFSCVEITLTSPKNPDYKRKEYYAPGIGEVKVVEYDGKNKNYETTLLKYSIE